MAHYTTVHVHTISNDTLTHRQLGMQDMRVSFLNDSENRRWIKESLDSLWYEDRDAIFWVI